jgi:O-antigen/teichoic acid export membrane protein
MLEDIKITFRKSAVYGLGNMSTKLLGLVLIPLYTNQYYLTINEYGALSVLEITSQVLVALLSLTLSQSLTRWYWDAKFANRQKSIFFTTMLTLTIVSVIALTAGMLISSNISNLLFRQVEYAYIIKLMLINSVLQILITHIQTLLKLQSKAFYYSLISILKLTITLLLTVYFIVGMGKKLDGIFEAQLIGSSIALIALIPYTIKSSRLKIETRILLQMLDYSYPLMLASISGVFFSVIDRYSLNYMEGLEKVGVYTLGYKISSALKVIVITSIQLALSPVLMKKINQPNNKPYYAKVMTYFSMVMMFCVIGVSLFSLELIKVAAKDIIYWESANIVAILSFSFFFSMLKDSAFIGLQIVKQTKIAGFLIILSSLINLGLNILLIPMLSIYGAAIATLLSQVIFFIMIYISAQRYYRIPYELKSIFSQLIVGVILVSLGFFANDLSIGLRLIIKTILLGAYPVYLYLSKIISPKGFNEVLKG